MDTNHAAVRWAAAALVAVAMVIGVVAPASGAEGDAAPEPRHDPRIVGGTVAPAGAWPSQVALVLRSQSAATGQFCGGTVIDRSWILTAAHCVSDPPEWQLSASQVDVLVGTNSLTSGGTRIPAVELRVHPGWANTRLQNDVALVRLDRPVPATTPILALGTAADLVPGAAATAVGWGAVDDPPSSYPTALRQVDMALGSDGDCEPYSSIYVSATQLCSWAPGRGVCYGDSGGPLMVERGDGTWAQLGISSYVIGRCSDYPSYFTEVAAFSTWIRWQMRYGPHPNANAFVTHQYLDLLGRAPTNTELFYGVAALQDGQTPAAYVAGLLDGAAYGRRTGAVIRLYRAIFLRSPETAGLAYWVREANRGVSLHRIADLMVRAPEFDALYGELDDTGFVDLVYENVLHRDPSVGDLGYWVEELTSGRRTRGGVMVGFSESPEFKGAEADVVRVYGAFHGLMRRVPSLSERATWSGSTTSAIATFLLKSYGYTARF